MFKGQMYISKMIQNAVLFLDLQRKKNLKIAHSHLDSILRPLGYSNCVCWQFHKKNLFLKGKSVTGELLVEWSVLKVSLWAHNGSQMSINFAEIKPRRDHYIVQCDFLYITGHSVLSKLELAWNIQFLRKFKYVPLSESSSRLNYNNDLIAEEEFFQVHFGAMKGGEECGCWPQW